MYIYKGEYWEVIFSSWDQSFPGDCVVSSNKEKLSELNESEWVELGKIEKELERVATKLFGATMFNFVCLMNNAYRDGDRPNVHFHFIPRYDSNRIILGKNYQDIHFGYNFWKWKLNDSQKQKDIFSIDDKLRIYEMIKNEFNL